jgi:LAGLIDADG endonuclease
MRQKTVANGIQEVSRVRSTRREKLWGPKDRRRNLKLQKPYGKEQIQRKKLNPHYVVGFIDGEGSFSVSIGKHKTLKRGFEVRPEFEIEVRKDDQDILERVLITIGAGRIYDLSYERYGWYPHAKYKITSIWDMKEYLFPFLDAYPPQAKKGKSYRLFREIVLMLCEKEHLSDKGFAKIVTLRSQLRLLGKKARTFGSREGAGKPLAPWREKVILATNDRT